MVNRMQGLAHHPINGLVFSCPKERAIYWSQKLPGNPGIDFRKANGIYIIKIKLPLLENLVGYRQFFPFVYYENCWIRLPFDQSLVNRRSIRPFWKIYQLAGLNLFNWCTLIPLV